MKGILEYSRTSFLKGVAFAVGVVTTGLVAATLSSSIATFNGGDPLTASAMNGNFNAIKARLGTYCGQTAATTGNIGGYAAARQLCATACGVSTAHMCTGHELAISLQLGEAVPDGWYSSFGHFDRGAEVNRDCAGWTSAAAGTLGPAAGPSGPDNGDCSAMRPINCCS